jgi:hypothetical protein
MAKAKYFPSYSTPVTENTTRDAAAKSAQAASDKHKSGDKKGAAILRDRASSYMKKSTEIRVRELKTGKMY